MPAIPSKQECIIYALCQRVISGHWLVRWIRTVAFCGTEVDPPGEIVPIIESIGANAGMRVDTKTQFINDFVF